MRTPALSLLCAAFWSSGVAYAGPGDDVLKRMDDAANKGTDRYIKFQATTVEAGKSDKVMVFAVWTKNGQRLVDFLAPGDMKGTRVLSLSPAQMYVWLPAYGKVRRVASHATQQGFMGTTLAEADMATTHYAPLFQAAVASEDDAAWELKLTPQDGVKTAYPQLEMRIGKELGLPLEVRYFNKKGEHIKTETRSDYICESDVCSPGVLKMVDHTRGDAATTLKVEEIKFDTGVGDDRFSVRALQRGG